METARESEDPSLAPQPWSDSGARALPALSLGRISVQVTGAGVSRGGDSLASERAELPVIFLAPFSRDTQFHSHVPAHTYVHGEEAGRGDDTRIGRRGWWRFLEDR